MSTEAWVFLYFGIGAYVLRAKPQDPLTEFLFLIIWPMYLVLNVLGRVFR